ncbi:MAG: CrcB family protein, partial [Planctomycetota bacterium]
DAGEPWRLLLVVGVLGGFTTYSAFSAESYELARDGHAARAAAYVGATLVLGAGATALGAWLQGRLGGG